MDLKFWGSFCTFMEPVYVSVIRDMAVCCIYRHGILWELTVLILVDADCLGSRGTESGGELSQFMLLDLNTMWWAFSGVFWRPYLIGGCWWPVSWMTWFESHILFEVLGIRGIILAYTKWFICCSVQQLGVSKFKWCCATTKLAYIVHVLASWLEAAAHLSHADRDTFTCYPQTKIICQWCQQVLILSSLNVQFLVWTSLEACWCWLRWSVCQISYLPIRQLKIAATKENTVNDGDKIVIILEKRK